jgi:pimeloyl-ACP methyl ester carboxylesterase
MPSVRPLPSDPGVPRVLRGVASVNQRRIEYASIAPARPRRRAPTLVLLHESLDCLASWKDFPRSLARESGCPVLAFSRPGCGQSDPPAEPRGRDYLHVEANALLPALLTQQGIDRPLLVGHGDGASLALIHAAGFDVAGVVAMAPYAFVEEQTLARIRVARAVYASSDWRRRLAQQHRDADATFRAWSDTWTDPAFRDWTLEPILPAIRAPLLLIQGEDDPYASIAQVATIARAVRGPMRSLELEVVGHAPWSEAPDTVIAAIVALIDSELDRK